MKTPKVIKTDYGEAVLGMDTKHYREGLHLYMHQYIIDTYSDGTTKKRIVSLSEHVDRARAREIMEDIQERLF